MKRALLFAPYFLPRRRVGSMRPFRFAIHLREFGWAPTVLTIKTSGQRLTEKEARLLEGVEVIEINPPFDRTAAAESQLGLASGASEKRGIGKLGGSRLLGALDQQFPVDTWLLLFALRYRFLLKTLRHVRPHVVWTTGDPWSGLVISERLVRRLGTPWVADFRDPWTLSNVRSEGRAALSQAVDRYCERRIVQTADVVLFQAQQIERRYRRHYAGLNPATTTIYNSYDPDVFDDPVRLDEAWPREEGGALDVGFFGRFRAMSPAAIMADVLAEAHRRHGGVAAGIRVCSFGPLNEADARYAEAEGVRAQFVHREAVPLEGALSALRRFDLLLLSTEPRRDGIIPAKLLEYLAAGRPVLSLSKNPEVAAVLRRTGTGVQPGPEAKSEVADLLVACLEAKREGRPLPIPFEPNPSEIARFEARPTTRELARLFDSLVLEGGQGARRDSEAARAAG